ncbi:MAG: response regulator transcription factor [Geminicoccaceae bacterium]|nr:response regulator transcription factor [Geminicoccaceae bacterium]MCB2011542.1 response regulator transcription factor [Geminicoccaceae bacterium]
MRALLVEDDPVSMTLLRRIMEEEGMVVETAESGEEGLELSKVYDFDIAVVDLQLVDMHGAQFVRRMRNAKVETPVIIVSGNDSSEETVRSLTSGADDYLTKPIVKAEFVARVNAIVRRSKGHAAPEIKLGRMTLDLAARTVKIDGVPLKVTAKEYTILELLALRRGQPLTKEIFLDHLYGGGDEPEQKIIDVFICKLRKKISAINHNKHNIETVWGRGYVLKDLTDGAPSPAATQAAQAAQAGMQQAAQGLAEHATPFEGAGDKDVIPAENEIELLMQLITLQ